MRTRTLLVLLGGLFLLPGCTGQPEGVETPRWPAPRAVVLVTVDGVSPDETSLLGGLRATPTLEGFRENGVVWTDAWTAAPMTRPGAATYLTGLAPDRHGVRDDLFTSLDDGIPTLATELSAKGYQTAAFPDSAFLGFQSGLLRGFDIVADPPVPPIHPSRWLPTAVMPDIVVGNFLAWLETVDAGERYFAWLHFSRPLLRELRIAAGRAADPDNKQLKQKGRTGGLVTAVEGFDTAVGLIQQALADRGDLETTLLVIAGTSGDPGGGEDDLPGTGFSLHERALRVPLVVRYPDGVQPDRDVSRPVWAPDVPATIAELTGVSLSAEAEGHSLLSNPAPERILYAFSWAPLDQLGWPALRAARSGPFKRLEGTESTTFALDEGIEVDIQQEQRLAAALEQRNEPAAQGVPLDKVRPLLEERGLAVRPVPADGQAPEDKGVMRSAALNLLAGRMAMRANYRMKGENRFRVALELDPDNLGARVALGMIKGISWDPEGKVILGPAVERFPTRPDVLHWYAHAVWSESWQDAESLLELIAPFKLSDSDVLYDLACTRSLAEDLPASEAYLRRAIDAGFQDWGHVETDPDLRNLRASGKLSELLQEYRR